METNVQRFEISLFILALLFLFLANASWGAEIKDKAGVKIEAVAAPASEHLLKIREKINEGIKADYFGGCPAIAIDQIVARPPSQMWEFTVQRLLDIKMDNQYPLEAYSKSARHLKMAVDSLVTDARAMPVDYRESLTSLLLSELDEQYQIRLLVSESSNPQIVALAETEKKEVLTVTQEKCQ